jgi:hypothetical protein
MKKSNPVLLMVFLIQMTFVLIGQNENAHEVIRLKKHLDSANDDTLQIRLLTSLASFYYYHEQPDSCMKYAVRARGMAHSLLLEDHIKQGQSIQQKMQYTSRNGPPVYRPCTGFLKYKCSHGFPAKGFANNQPDRRQTRNCDNPSIIGLDL